MKKKFVLFGITSMLLLSLTGCVKGTTTDLSGTTPKIYNNDIYEFVDPDTGVHYWVYSHQEGYSGMGGMTLRLNSDGSVMVNK